MFDGWWIMNTAVKISDSFFSNCIKLVLEILSLIPNYGCFESYSPTWWLFQKTYYDRWSNSEDEKWWWRKQQRFTCTSWWWMGLDGSIWLLHDTHNKYVLNIINIFYSLMSDLLVTKWQHITIVLSSWSWFYFEIIYRIKTLGYQVISFWESNLIL